ncbi:MAG: gene transfer agent family protein [Erythrobacter sp.]
MMKPANPIRGEAELIVGGKTLVIRPTFEALIASEKELGSLFSLVEHASDGALTLTEIAALLWHCTPAKDKPSRDEVGEAVLASGLIAATKPVRIILTQVLQGQP